MNPHTLNCYNCPASVALRSSERAGLSVDEARMLGWRTAGLGSVWLCPICAQDLPPQGSGVLPSGV